MMHTGDRLPTAPDRRLMDYLRYCPVDDLQSRYFAAWRGGSAIFVLIGHGFDIFYADPHPIWGVIATCSVLVFFGLSGFFIHKALAKSLARARPLDFVIGRVNRVLPSLAFAMIVTIALWAIAPALFLSGSHGFVTPTARTQFSLEGLVPSTLLLNGFIGPTLSANGPLWSLSYEVWYYAAAYLAGIAIFRCRRWLMMAAVVLLLALTAANPRFAILGTIWVLGFGLSALHGQGKVPRLPSAPFLMAAAAAVLAAALTPFPGAQLLANVLIGLWFVIHMGQVLNGGALWKIDFLERSSRFAYALYVLHFPLLLFVYGATGERSWMILPAVTVVYAAIAVFGHKLEGIKIVGRASDRLGSGTGNDLRGGE